MSALNCSSIVSANGPPVASEVRRTNPPRRQTVIRGFSISTWATFTAGTTTKSSMSVAAISRARVSRVEPSFMKTVSPDLISSMAARATARFSATYFISRIAKASSAGREVRATAPP